MKRLLPIFAAAVLLGTVLIVPGIVDRWGVDSSTDSLVLEADPEALRYDRNALIFSNDEFVLVGLQRDDLFTPAGVAAVESLHAAFEAITISVVDTATGTTNTVKPIASVWSLARAPVVLLRSFREPISPFAALGKQATATSPEIDLVKARAELIDHELFSGNLISKDGNTAGILVTLRHRPRSVKAMRTRLELYDRRALARDQLADAKDEVARGKAQSDLAQVQVEIDVWWPEWVASEDIRKRERIAALIEIEKIVDQAKADGQKLGRSGVPAIVVDMVKAIDGDFKTFLGLSVAFVFAFLFFVFRRVAWVLLPLCATGATVAWTLFGMQAFDKKVTVITANVPALLLVIRLAHSIHLVVRFRELMVRFPQDSKSERVTRLVSGLVWPCLFTATTTAAGFASLYYAGSRPIIDFGFFMAAGVGLSFFFSFLFLPAGMLLLPVTQEGRLERSARFLSGLGRVSLERKPLVLGLTVVLVALACFGITRLQVEARFLDYFRPSSPIHAGLKYVDQNLGGTSALEIVLDGHDRGAFGAGQTANLDKAAKVVKWLEDREEVGAVMSFPGLIDEFRKLVPTMDRGQAAAALLFQLDPDMLSSYIVTKPATVAGDVVQHTSRLRIVARVRETHPNLKRHELIRDLRAFLAETFPPATEEGAPEAIGAEMTGMFVLYANMLSSLGKTQVKTSGIALLAIWIMLSLLFRNPFAALLALIPNMVPIALVLGAMGWSGIPLDMATVMIASVSLGIGVDCAIHYLFRYREEIGKDGDIRAAIERSHGSIGTSILYTSLTSVVGFVVLVVSEFLPNAYFGLFTAFAMVVALFAMLTLLPVLIALSKPFGAAQRRGLALAASKDALVPVGTSTGEPGSETPPAETDPAETAPEKAPAEAAEPDAPAEAAEPDPPEPDPPSLEPTDADAGASPDA
ncbi:MAG: MMPL family transporter [Planctomycetes bacterium]|nr:MMPL family transporter [Planctomycetota bacterium]